MVVYTQKSSTENLSIDTKDHTQEIFDIIYEHVDIVMENYDHILNPKTNNLTQSYILQGYDLKKAYALSFTCTVSLYMNLINT